MTASAQRLAKIMGKCNIVVTPAEKSFSEFCKETVQNGKFNMKAIFSLAWREVKKSVESAEYILKIRNVKIKVMSFKDALSYAWRVAKDQLLNFQRNKNLDLRGMGFTRLD